MQPRRNARTGSAAVGGGAALLVSSFMSAGRSGGTGGKSTAVIRVGMSFQASVPPWRGPEPLDGSVRAEEGLVIAAAPAVADADATEDADADATADADAAGSKKSARVVERAASIAASAAATPKQPHAARIPGAKSGARESEPARRDRLAGIKVWPPAPAEKAAKIAAELFDPSLSPGRRRGGSTGGGSAEKRERAPGGSDADAGGLTLPGKRVKTATEMTAAADPFAKDYEFGLQSALAAIPADSAVKKAAAQRAAAAMARAMAASREDATAKQKTAEEAAARAAAVVVAATKIARAELATGLPGMPPGNAATLAEAHGVRDPKPRRPSLEEVAAARAKLESELRAARSSPAVMGVQAVGRVVATEAFGLWTAEQSRAFEEQLRARKFDLFGCSRIGRNPKKGMKVRSTKVFHPPLGFNI